MLAIGDVHLYVTDLQEALRFWRDGAGLTVIDEEHSPNSGYALLDFPSGGSSLRLIAPADPWRASERPEHGSRPMIGFELLTDDFDGLVTRLTEFGGRQLGEIDMYNELRVGSFTDPDGNTFEVIETPPEA